MKLRRWRPERSAYAELETVAMGLIRDHPDHADSIRRAFEGGFLYASIGRNRRKLNRSRTAQQRFVESYRSMALGFIYYRTQGTSGEHPA